MDSVKSQKQLLQTHVYDSQQKTMEVRGEVSCAQKQLEARVGPHDALTTVTLSEFLHYKNMQVMPHEFEVTSSILKFCI